jgi:hypothetical protein
MASLLRPNDRNGAQAVMAQMDGMRTKWSYLGGLQSEEIAEPGQEELDTNRD